MIKRKFILLILVIIILMIIGIFPLTIYGTGWYEKGYNENEIQRYITNPTKTMNIEIVYLYHDNFFLSYFPDLSTLVNRLTINDASGISLPQFFHKYTDYNWNFHFQMVYKSYIPNIPDWATMIYGIPQGPNQCYGCAAEESFLNWCSKQSTNYLKNTDIFVLLTDDDIGVAGYYVGYAMINMWAAFDPAGWGRYPGYGGAGELWSMRHFKQLVAHEMVHAFGAKDHPSGLIIGDNWGDSLDANLPPYIDEIAINQEIHWGQILKTRFYIVPITISGIVTDAFTGSHLPDCTIYFNGEYKGTTNSNGYFSFDFNGGYGLFLVQKAGYEDTNGPWAGPGINWWTDKEVTIPMIPVPMCYSCSNGETISQPRVGDQCPEGWTKWKPGCTDKTPGFEIIILILAIIIIFLLNKYKNKN